MKFRFAIRSRFRWFGSWLPYWLGHLVSMPMRRCGRLYPLYSRLMLWSLSIQGDAKQGPWGPDLSGKDQGAGNRFYPSRGEAAPDLESPLRPSDPHHNRDANA